MPCLPVTSVSAQVSDAPGKVLWKQIQQSTLETLCVTQEGLAVDGVIALPVIAILPMRIPMVSTAPTWRC
jgi:hypothetical protein